MTTREFNFASASALRAQLDLLERERTSAALAGLGDNALYMDDLLDEIEATRSAYVGAAVTEIATLHALLDGPLHG